MSKANADLKTTMTIWLASRFLCHTNSVVKSYWLFGVSLFYSITKNIMKITSTMASYCCSKCSWWQFELDGYWSSKISRRFWSLRFTKLHASTVSNNFMQAMTSNNLNGHNDLTRPEPSLVDHNYVMLTITWFQIKFIPEQARLEPVEPSDIDYVSFFESNWPLVTSSLIWPCQACKIFMVSPCKPFRKDVSLELLLNARVHQPYHASGWQRITTKSVFLLPSC